MDSEAQAQQIAGRAKAALSQGISGLFESGAFADLVIRLGEKSWNVHRSVVCVQSKFFEKACGGDWREANNKAIELHDDDESVVPEMLRYMYLCEYNDAPANASCGRVVFNVRMAQLANKYLVSNLFPLTVVKIGKATEPSNVDRDDFQAAVAEAYENTSRVTEQLRTLLFDMFMLSTSEQLGATAEEKRTLVQRLAKTPVFAAEALKKALEMDVTMRARQFYICTGCELGSPAVMQGGPAKSYRCPNEDCAWEHTHEDWGLAKVSVQFDPDNEQE